MKSEENKNVKYQVKIKIYPNWKSKWSNWALFKFVWIQILCISN